MSDQHSGGPGPVPPAVQERPLDPRGVRVSVAGPDEPPELLVIEPAAVPIGPMAPSTGQGLLGGVAGVPAVPLDDDPEVGLMANGSPLEATLQQVDAEHAILRLADGERHRVLLLEGESGNHAAGRRREVVIDGWRIEVDVEPAARAALRDRASRGREEARRSGPSEVRAIIPGVVVSVSVVAGDLVQAGQQLLVVEAMKMQNELRAPREGSIERVAVAPGATIEVGDLLLVIA